MINNVLQLSFELLYFAHSVFGIRGDLRSTASETHEGMTMLPLNCCLRYCFCCLLWRSALKAFQSWTKRGKRWEIYWVENKRNTRPYIRPPLVSSRCMLSQGLAIQGVSIALPSCIYREVASFWGSHCARLIALVPNCFHFDGDEPNGRKWIMYKFSERRVRSFYHLIGGRG